MNEAEVERTTVGQTQGALETEPVKARDVHVIGPGEAALDFEVRRHRLAGFGEMLIDGEMVVDPSEASALLEQLAIAHRLLDETLHVCVPSP